MATSHYKLPSDDTNTWLMKSEPDAYSFDELEKTGRGMWDGVRNYAARNNLRAMRRGDQVLFYHSNIGMEVVGICEVITEHYPDPTAESGDWSVVDVKPLLRLPQTVTLKTIKATPELANIALIKQSRLSVMPVQREEFLKILEMALMVNG
jgi:predicted RNA-binding protein with PUA-like domain